MPRTQDFSTVSEKKTFQKPKTRKKQAKQTMFFFFWGGGGFPKCALDLGFDDSLAKKAKTNKKKAKKNIPWIIVCFFVFFWFLFF